MTTSYVLNVIKTILNQRVIGEPNCVPRNELARSILEDLDMAIEQLMEDGLVEKHNSLNDVLFYVKEEEG